MGCRPYRLVPHRPEQCCSLRACRHHGFYFRPKLYPKQPVRNKRPIHRSNPKQSPEARKIEGLCQRRFRHTISMKRIAILGSTGSIGRSTLSVAESYPDRFQIMALAAGSNLDAAFEQAMRWRPRVISMAAEADADALRSRLKARESRRDRSCARRGGNGAGRDACRSRLRGQRHRRRGWAGGDLRGGARRQSCWVGE